MPLKKFNDYLIERSTDPKQFEKKVAFASSNIKCDLFEVLSEESQILNGFTNIPIVIWGKFNFTPKLVNENRYSIYNIGDIPDLESVYSAFESRGFVPRSMTDRSEVSKLKFPILGLGEKKPGHFATYNKYKKSEGQYKKFRESPVVDARFNAIIFKKKPIHIQENVSTIGFDVDLNRFKYMDQIKEVVDAISERHVIDIYQLDFIKSGGKIYLSGINRNGTLSPSQKVKIYEEVYENHYSSRLPVWFKKRLFENNVKDFYRKSYYDSLLLKPKYSIDFKKFA